MEKLYEKTTYERNDKNDKKTFKLINLTKKIVFKLVISKEKNLFNLFKFHYKEIIEAYPPEKITNSHIQYNCFKFDSCVENQMDKDCLICNLSEYEEQNLDLYFITPNIKSKENLFGLLELTIDDKTEELIPLLGNLEVPKLICMKEIYSPNAIYPLISLKIKIQSKGQKFNLPFRNLSVKDMAIDFDFEKNKHSYQLMHKNNIYGCQLFCFPSRY